jgi:hypothetical protein
MSGSSVLFMAFPTRDAPGLVAWTRFRELISRGMSASDPTLNDRATMVNTSPVGIWRMLASNNREVARSAIAYPSFESARRGVLDLQQVPEPFDIRTFHGPSSGMHGWAALADDRVVLTCARWYETASISLEVSASSISAFRTATVTEAPWQTAATAREARVARLAVQAW